MDRVYNIKIDKSGDIPLYQQLSEQITLLIEQGEIKPNEKLPPIRKLAEALNVNNVTVVNAYKHLENKKIVYSHVGSGTFVSEIKLSELPEPVLKNQYSAGFSIDFDIQNAINFAKSTVNPDLFPVNEFKAAFNEVLDRDLGNAFSYQESQGYMPLRSEICKDLLKYNIKTSEDKIQIISGAQQGIDIISKSMLGIGDVVFVEKPTYYGALGAFASRGAQIIEIDMQPDGMDMDRLESLLKVMRPKFIYIMSYFQTPTCYSYCLDKKYRLLNLAAKYDTYILEEDNQNEFIYNNEDIIPVKALDYKNRVMYVKSYSKSIMPGLRIGFMALPKKILNHVLSIKYTTDIATSGFIQRAFELFLSSGGYDRHIRQMREIFKVRYNTAVKAIDTYLDPYVTYIPPQGGLNLWLTLKDKTMSSESLSQKLLKENVIITPGSLYSAESANTPSFRLSYAGVDNAYISLGIRKIATRVNMRKPLSE